MDNAQIRQMTRTLMDQHGLLLWKVRISSAARQFGSCNYSTQTISISAPLSRKNPDKVEGTILHEIAHALAGPGAGHGPAWKAVCRRIGAAPERTVEAEAPDAPYMRVCPSCNTGSPVFRRTKTRYACRSCCDRYNGGRWAEEFLMAIIPTRDYTPSA